MLKNKLLNRILGIMVITLIATTLSSCGTARKMGCPMEFTQARTAFVSEFIYS